MTSTITSVTTVTTTTEVPTAAPAAPPPSTAVDYSCLAEGNEGEKFDALDPQRKNTVALAKGLLHNRVCWHDDHWQDFRQHLKWNHIILSVFGSHKNAPISKCERFLLLLATWGWALCAAAFGEAQTLWDDAILEAPCEIIRPVGGNWVPTEAQRLASAPPYVDSGCAGQPTNPCDQDFHDFSFMNDDTHAMSDAQKSAFAPLDKDRRHDQSNTPKSQAEFDRRCKLLKGTAPTPVCEEVRLKNYTLDGSESSHYTPCVGQWETEGDREYVPRGINTGYITAAVALFSKPLLAIMTIFAKMACLQPGECLGGEGCCPKFIRCILNPIASAIIRLLVLISVIVGAAGLAQLNSTGKEFVGVYGKDFADEHVNTSNFANTWLQGVLTAAFGVDIFFSYVSFRGKYKEQATNSFLLHPKKKSVLLAKTLCGGKKHMNFVNMNPYPGFPSKTFLESGVNVWEGPYPLTLGTRFAEEQKGQAAASGEAAQVVSQV